MLHNPFKIVKMFEEEVAQYAGSKYAVAVDSCTDAIFLCLQYHKQFNKVVPIRIPLRTYVSVPQEILKAGFELEFEDCEWSGTYNLMGTRIIDSAKRFTSGMYVEGSLMCLSFHMKKHLPIGKGGMILTDDFGVYEWLKKARYEGRSEVKYHVDNIDSFGWNMYMRPDDAARGLMIMQNMPLHNDDLVENPGYPPLSKHNLFKEIKVYDEDSRLIND